MVVVKLSMFVLEGCKPPVDPNLQRGYRLYVQEKITMHTLSGTEIQKICASMEFEGNQFSTDIFVNTVTGEVLQRVCSCKSLECDNLYDHEAAALFKYVNEEWKENSPSKSPPKSSRSRFWRIGLPVMAGVTAVAAAPLVLTSVGITSAGIAAGSFAASMMSSAAVANGGGVASGGKTMESDGEIDKFVVEPYQFEPPARQRIDVESSSDSDEDSESDRDKLNVDEQIGNVAWKCDNLCDHEAAALFKYVNEGLKENSPPKSPPKSSGSGFWTIGLPIMAGVTAVAAAPLVLTAVGFTSAGIAAKSLAAGMMSKAAVANGGGVAARSLVAVLQSAGAAGIGTTGSAIIGGTATGVTAGGQAIAQKVRESGSQKKP